MPCHILNLIDTQFKYFRFNLYFSHYFHHSVAGAEPYMGVGGHQITKAQAKKGILLAGYGHTREDCEGISVLD